MENSQPENIQDRSDSLVQAITKFDPVRFVYTVKTRVLLIHYISQTETGFLSFTSIKNIF